MSLSNCTSSFRRARRKSWEFRTSDFTENLSKKRNSFRSNHPVSSDSAVTKLPQTCASEEVLRKALISYIRNQDVEEAALDSFPVESEEDFGQKYELQEFLGDGATCSVRRAVCTETGENFAVKIIDIDKLKRQKGLIREVQIMRDLDHPNIIKLQETILTPEHLYIIMELASGYPLFDAIVENKHAYTEVKVKKILKKILLAIEYLHSKGIAHRDLKPENIVFSSPFPDAELKLVDFGFARCLTEDGYSTPTGTLGYKAPEIFKDEVYDKSVDMWSLGVIAYILLCGFPPFFSFPEYKDDDMLNNAPFWFFFNSYTETLKKEIIEAKITFPDPFWKKISHEAKDFVSSLLEGNPRKRINATQALKHRWFEIEDYRVTRSLSFARRNIEKYSEGELQFPHMERADINFLEEKLIDHFVISEKNSPVAVSPNLQEIQKKLIFSASKDSLGRKLKRRPTLEFLISQNIFDEPEPT